MRFLRSDVQGGMALMDIATFTILYMDGYSHPWSWLCGVLGGFGLITHLAYLALEIPDADEGARP